MHRFIGSVVVLSALAGMVGVAQEDKRLADRFDRALRSNAPAASRDRISDSDPGVVYQRWQSGVGAISARTIHLQSVEEAKEALTKMLERPVPAQRIAGLGADAYLFAPSDPKGERLILLRSGRVLLEVRANGEANVRRYSGLFLAELRRFEAAEHDRDSPGE